MNSHGQINLFYFIFNKLWKINKKKKKTEIPAFKESYNKIKINFTIKKLKLLISPKKIIFASMVDKHKSRITFF